MKLWNMTYGDQLLQAILEYFHGRQQKYFLKVYERMGEYVRRYGEYLTFREYFEMHEK